MAKLLSDRGDLAERQLKSLMNAYHSACSFDSTRLVETTKLRHYLSDLESKETSLRRALALLKCVSDEKTQEPSDVARGLDELSEEIKRLTECDELDIADSLSKSQSVHSLALRGHLEDKVASSAVDTFPTSEFRALLELQLQLFKDKQHIAHHSSVWALGESILVVLPFLIHKIILLLCTGSHEIADSLRIISLPLIRCHYQAHRGEVCISLF